MNAGFGATHNIIGSCFGSFLPTIPDLTPMVQLRNIKRGPQPLVLTGTLPTGRYHWYTKGASTIDVPFLSTLWFEPNLTRTQFNPHGYQDFITMSASSFEPQSEPMLNQPECVGISLGSTTLGEQLDLVLEITKSFFQKLANDYVAGSIDVPEIKRRLGALWTEGEVVLLLETLGAHRSISSFTLPQEEKEKILEELAKIRGTPEADKFDDPSWIRREVVASQRIESVYVSTKDLLSE